MVTIKVPVGTNGWMNEGWVQINGKIYTFPVGVETQVPESVVHQINEIVQDSINNQPPMMKPPSGSVATDKTLTVDGAAADAKVTGDRFATLSKEMAKKDKPLVYIDGAIPTTKDNVLATMTVKSKWLNIFAYIKIKCQGSSSMSYPKKNFTLTLYQDEARTIPLEIVIPGWKHASNKFVLKANYIDHLHARNIISARLWSEVVASRPDYDALPEELRNSPNNGAVDGFPVIVYTNGAYQGIYTWNIGKDAWLWGMNEDNPNHVLMCAETNTDGVYAETPCNFRALWNGVNEDYWSVEVGENSDAVKNALNNLIGFVMNATDDEFVAQIETYLDVQSAIDYYLFSCANCGIDNLGKNMLLGKYGSQKWMLGQYDLDSTWGLWWDGSKFISYATQCPDAYQERYSLLFERISKCFTNQLVKRGQELRKTVLSVANINAHFERFVVEIGAEAYADDVISYTGIPSAEENNIWQIRRFVKDRMLYFDAWLSGMQEGDYDTPYSLKSGIYSASAMGVGDNSILTVSDGNNIKLEFDNYSSVVIADLVKGMFGPSVLFEYTNEWFGLKAGDVVTRKLKNVVSTGEFNNRSLSLSLYSDAGEVKFTNLTLSELTGEDIESTITAASDMSIGSMVFWCGPANNMSNGTVSFDVEIYVNGERYV